ncbi:hypothetical protein SAMN04488071_2299 [Kordiimonas lacus]|uniref:Uncharacterized protein n=1 Tax=Kordiimonas lacus TaxID=637679 RepID=A0A1G7B0L8_9PROT|nr:hypothetical protein SAMN04488071_2299 [Kordiimonas lacus]
MGMRSRLDSLRQGDPIFYLTDHSNIKTNVAFRPEADIKASDQGSRMSRPTHGANRALQLSVCTSGCVDLFLYTIIWYYCLI